MKLVTTSGSAAARYRENRYQTRYGYLQTRFCDSHTEFKGEVYVLSKEEGGRHTPFFNKYRPQFYFRTTDVTGEITLPEGTEMIMPGDNVTIHVKLIQRYRP